MSHTKMLRLRPGFGVALFASVLLTANNGPGGGLALAQTPAGTAFSYQGRLTDGGAPASGLYDLRFTLFDAATATGAVGTPVVAEDVTVSGGLFTVMLDFGGAAFTGDARWLEIAARPGASVDAFITLATRQRLMPAPHAIFSQTSQHSVTSQSSDATPWTGVTGKPAGFADDADNDALGALACASAGQIAKWTGSAWTCAADVDASGLDWKLAGNAATGGTAVLGTLDNASFTLVAGGVPIVRYAPDAGSPRIVAGHPSNSGNFAGSTIAGGGANGTPNVTTGTMSTISGGYGNTAAHRAVVAGGLANTATGLASVASGGDSNQAPGDYAIVGGGRNNVATGMFATIAGGENNEAAGFYGTVAGGWMNRADGNASFAAGNRAQALHTGSFVWGDSQSANSASTGPNQFIVRASGGIWFGASSVVSLPAGRFINTTTGAYLSSAGDWTNASDRNLKERIEPIDGARLLDRLAALPISTWSYKSSPDVRHIGPMAQDFQAVFGFGGDDKAISTIDPAGIALGAIQELHRRLEAQAAALAELRALVRQLQQQPPPQQQQQQQ